MKNDLARKTLPTTSQCASRKIFLKKLVAGFPGISGVDKIELSAKKKSNFNSLKIFTKDSARQMVTRLHK